MDLWKASIVYLQCKIKLGSFSNQQFGLWENIKFKKSHMFYPWSKRFSISNSCALWTVSGFILFNVTFIIKHDQIKYEFVEAELLSQRTPRVIVTLCKVHLQWSKTSLKHYPLGQICMCMFVTSRYLQDGNMIKWCQSWQ